MNKAELVTDVAERVNLSKKTVEDVLNGLTDAVVAAMERGETVQLVGFGTWEVRTRSARTGRNPQTGATLAIPAKRVPLFRPGTRLGTAASQGARG